jgi:hypothetical protein
VKNLFQSLPFKCNLQRYNAAQDECPGAPDGPLDGGWERMVGLCKLNPV